MASAVLQKHEIQQNTVPGTHQLQGDTQYPLGDQERKTEIFLHPGSLGLGVADDPQPGTGHLNHLHPTGARAIRMEFQERRPCFTDYCPR